jgi:hypothetical protein
LSSSFTVFGAPIPYDSALTSVGAELFLTPRWTLLAQFDGEFAHRSQTYRGTGTLAIPGDALSAGSGRDVSSWHKADMSNVCSDVGFRGQSGPADFMMGWTPPDGIDAPK